MKITKLKFKQIIKEELSRTLNENPEKMKALADELGGELQWDNDDQAIIYLDQEPAPGTYPPQMTYEDGVLYTDYFISEGEEDVDPRSSLGGMVDVDYEDPIKAPIPRGLEERKITKSQIKQIIKEEIRRFLTENRGAVQDYLYNLPEDELIKIAADFLGEEPDFINQEYAMQWVDGLSQDEVDEISAQMTGGVNEALPPHLQSKVDAYEKKKQKFSITDVTPPGYGPDEPEEEPLKLGTPKRDPTKKLKPRSMGGPIEE